MSGPASRRRNRGRTGASRRMKLGDVNTKLSIKFFSGPKIGLIRSIPQPFNNRFEDAISGVLELLKRNGLPTDRNALSVKLRVNPENGLFMDGLIFDGHETLAFIVYTTAAATPNELDSMLMQSFDIFTVFRAIQSGRLADLIQAPTLPALDFINDPLPSIMWTASAGPVELLHAQ